MITMVSPSSNAPVRRAGYPYVATNDSKVMPYNTTENLRGKLPARPAFGIAFTAEKVRPGQSTSSRPTYCTKSSLLRSGPNRMPQLSAREKTSQPHDSSDGRLFSGKRHWLPSHSSHQQQGPPLKTSAFLNPLKNASRSNPSSFS